MSLNEQITEIDKLIAARFREHELAEVISSMPGIGPRLGAEFLAATAGDMSRYGTADRLTSLAGVAPVPRDSGNISGNLHRPRRYHRGLQRVFYTSALISIRSCDESRRFYASPGTAASVPAPSPRAPAGRATASHGGTGVRPHAQLWPAPCRSAGQGPASRRAHSGPET